MSALVCMIRYELLLQWRTTRFRLAVALYVAICALPSALVLLVFRHRSDEALGAASYLGQTLAVQPWLTTLLAVLVAGNRSSIEALRDVGPVLVAMPMSSTGYFLRRWLALLTVIIPLSIIPQVVTLGVALAAGHRTFEPWTWCGTWLVQILPVAVAVSAYWLGMVTILGGELGVVLATFFALPFVISMLNEGLIRFHLNLGRFGELLGFGNFTQWFYWTRHSWQVKPREPEYRHRLRCHRSAFRPGHRGRLAAAPRDSGPRDRRLRARPGGRLRPTHPARSAAAAGA